MPAENRFWSAQLTYALAGLKLAKLAGVFSGDLVEVFKWMTNGHDSLVVSNKRKADDLIVTPVEAVSQYLAENWNNILQVSATDNEASLGNAPVPPPEQAARVKLMARYETDTGMLFLPSSMFRQWCVYNQLDYLSIITALSESHNAVVNVPKRMATGTKLAMKAQRVIQLNWNSDDSGSPSG